MIPVFAGILCLAPVARAFQDGGPPAARDDPDETDGEKLKPRETWEILVNIPGQILYLPFRLLYGGVKPVLAFIDKTNLPARLTDLFTSDDGKRSAYPIYESRTGAGFEINQKDLLQEGTELEIEAAAGLRSRHGLGLKFRGYRLGTGLSIGFDAEHKFLSDEDYYGFGNDSPAQDETSYGYRHSAFASSFELSIDERTQLTSFAGIERNTISRGRNPIDPSITALPPEVQAGIPGLLDRVNLFSLGLRFEHDSRNRPGNPSAGWIIDAGGGLYRQLGGQTYDFLKAGFDITRLLHLFYGRILVLRTAGEFSRPSHGGAVPFYHLSTLGERRTIRGFHRGRFLDRDKLIFSLEYRWPLIKRPGGMISLDALLFADWGKVSPDLFDEPLFKDYHRGIGGGIRVYTNKGTHIQLFFGKSRDGYRVYLVINE